MWEVSHVVEDEQILFRAVVTAEAVGVELLSSRGVVADMMGWRHCGRVVSEFSVLKNVWHVWLIPDGISGFYKRKELIIKSERFRKSGGDGRIDIRTEQRREWQQEK